MRNEPRAGGEAAEEARRWFARLRSGRVTEQDRAGFEAWLQESPGNRAEYRINEGIWQRLGDLAADAEIMTAEAGEDSRRLARIRRRAGWSSSLAPGVPGAAAACVVGVGILLSWIASPPAVLRTDSGEQAVHELRDGSVVHLNTQTTVRPFFTESERRLVLERGEAFFRVASDVERPFVVVAGDGFVRALGTTFNVLVRDGGEVTVDVLKGRVAVETREGRGEATVAPELTLRADEQITYGGPQTPSGVRKASTERIRAWLDGKLVFDARPLAEVVGEVNRYMAKQIVLEEADLGKTPISGVFRLAEVEAVVTALERTLPICVAHDPGKIVLRKGCEER